MDWMIGQLKIIRRFLLTPGGTILLICLAVCLSGCGDTPSPHPGPVATGVITKQQGDCERMALALVNAIQSGDKQTARKMLSPSLIAKPSLVDSIQTMSGPYALLAGSSEWTFEPVEELGHTKKLVLRAKFKGSDGNTCRTNILFSQSADKLLIENILPPGKHGTPLSSKPSGISKK